jgi:hypothetical protein
MSPTGLKNPQVGPVLTPPGAADHHCGMKSLLSVLALSAALGFAAGCAPEKAFCPNTSMDAGGVCPVYGDDAQTQGKDSGGTCGGQTCGTGEYCGEDPNGGGGTLCLCSIGGTLPPCN